MKRFQSIGVLLSSITGLLVLLLVLVFTNSARLAYERRQYEVRMLDSVQSLRDLSDATDILHVEEGRVRTALASLGMPGPAASAEMARLTGGTDISLDRATSTLAAAGAKAPLLGRTAAARRIYDRVLSQVTIDLALADGRRNPHLGQAWSDAINDLTLALQQQADLEIANIATTNSVEQRNDEGDPPGSGAAPRCWHQPTHGGRGHHGRGRAVT